MYYHYHLLLEKDIAVHLNRTEFSLLKNVSSLSLVGIDPLVLVK